MATIVADDALADSAGAPIDVDILEIKLTAYDDVTYYIRETSFSYVCKQKTISC